MEFSRRAARLGILLCFTTGVLLLKTSKSVTCACHSDSSVVGFALGESSSGETHSHCAEEMGEVNPVLEQPSATVPRFAFILPRWTPGS